MNTQQKLFALNLADYVQSSFSLRDKIVTVLNEEDPTARDAVVGLVVLAVIGAKGGGMSKESFMQTCECLFESVSSVGAEKHCDGDIISVSQSGDMN